MFFHLLYPLSDTSPLFNVFRYITFRSFIGFFLGMLLAIYLGKKFIILMKKYQFGQFIREVGPESHKKKGGTPTMGGVFIWVSALIAVFLCGNFYSIPLWVTLFVAFSYGILGLFDDYKKISKKNSDGISARGKLAWQFITAIVAMIFLISSETITTELYVPFLKNAVVDLGWFYVVFGSLVIVGSSNAVNLTDGLDGLAIGPISISLATLGILTYFGGHSELANYLLIPYVPQQGELVVLCSALIGAGMGFLWYNAYPAQIFMGDLGALSLGGVLGIMCVISKNELLFVIFGGIFVIEALSVILQVYFFKTQKRRIFKMAPIHHHYELMGWEEPKVIVRFWIISLLLAVIALATLKLR
jgi:phospho-N-acetylmuramoyl-pentapeptide-transferase